MICSSIEVTGNKLEEDNVGFQFCLANKFGIGDDTKEGKLSNGILCIPFDMTDAPLFLLCFPVVV